MHREEPNIACPVKDRKAGHNAIFEAVLIYENFAAGLRARRFFEALARASDKALKEQMWNFEVLGIREARNAAASAARKADVVAVSVSGQLELPGTVQGVVRYVALATRRRKSRAHSIVRFIRHGKYRVHSRLFELRCPTRQDRFFLAHKQVSLFPAVPSKEEGTWTKSVEQALLSWLKPTDEAR
jgi:hypothetical protein